MEGHLEERPHLIGSTGLSRSSLEACAATSKLMNMERRIVLHVVNELFHIFKSNVSCTHS